MLSDEIRLPPGKATSRVAFAFMLLEDGFLAGFKKNPTHLLPWPELLRSLTLVKNKILTAEALRTRRKVFLFGGERPPNKKPSSMSKRAPFAGRSDETQL